MATFQAAFKPAVNKVGLSKLTFKGVNSKSGQAPVKDKEGNILKDDDGNVLTRDWVLINLEFECMGAVRGTFQKISITSNDKYSEDNLLGISLKGMGFKMPELDLEEDEDGFAVTGSDLPDDEFEQFDDTGLDAIDEFLKTCIDKTFVAKVNKATEGKRKGYWEIDVKTLKPFVKS